MNAELEGGEWSAARTSPTLPLGKTRYLLYRRLCGPQGLSGRAENLVPSGIRFRTVQPLVSRYTDRATQPTSPKGCRGISSYTRILYHDGQQYMPYMKHAYYCLFIFKHTTGKRPLKISCNFVTACPSSPILLFPPLFGFLGVNKNVRKSLLTFTAICDNLD